MAFSSFFNIIFSPLLALPTLLAIIILSFLVSLLIIVITKFMTDQALMKRLKEEMKEYQKQAKELKSEPAKAMAVQKKAMEVNMKYMMKSFKPTIITFIPIILIFGWMSSTFAYESIKPGQEFSVTTFFGKDVNGNAQISASDGIDVVGNEIQKIENSQATWKLKGEEGEHILEFDYGDEKYQTSVLITNKNKYINPLKKTNGVINAIKINYKKFWRENLNCWNNF